MTPPGVGALTALAHVLIIGTPARFPRGQQIGNYVWMIPQEDSSTGKQRLGHIGKRGNSFGTELPPAGQDFSKHGQLGAWRH